MTDIAISSATRYGDAPYFIFCDHASNVIPPELKGLGIPDDVLNTHIAWDIGAGALAMKLGEQLKGTVFACGFSRLIVDVNRALEAHDIIPAVSDQIPIPGNQMLTDEGRKQRIEAYHVPYHDRLGAAIERAVAEHGEPMIVSVHSFTNRLMGAADDRPWKVGLLWREDETSAKAMIGYLKDNTGWAVGDNEPYDARVFNYSIDRHVGPKGLPHLTFEVRQDVIAGEHDISRTTELLAGGIREIAAASGRAPR